MVLSKLGGKSIGESSVEVTRIAEVARVSISVFDFLSFFYSSYYATVKGSSGQSTVIKLPLSSGEFFVKLYIKLYAEVPQDNKIDPHQPSVGYVTHVIYIIYSNIYVYQKYEQCNDFAIRFNSHFLI